MIAVLAASCGSDADGTDSPSGADETSAVETFLITGSITTAADVPNRLGPPTDAGPCLDAAAKVAEGDTVVVMDGEGNKVAAGEVSAGVLDAKPGDFLISAKCQFGFAVGQVPDGGAVYTIQVAGTDPVDFAREDLDGLVNLSRASR